MAMELPSDLVVEILSWVPAMSLGRLRYVCKQWNTIIANPGFVKKQLSRSRGHEQHQYTVFNVNEASTRLPSAISCVGIDFDELDIPSLNLQVFKRLGELVYNMVHCDGLLVLVMKQRLLVLNPLLKEGRWIHCGIGFGNSKDVYGLGYISNQSSSIPNDYKLVRFRCTYFRSKRESRVEVYDFTSDSWKVVVEEAFDGFWELPKSSVCLKGTPYWIGVDTFPPRRKLVIQSFDFSKERFEPLSCPPSSMSEKDSVSLGIFKGDHLFLLHRPHSSAYYIHLWVMKQQWNKMMKIPVSGGPICSSYFSENNGKLVLYCRNLYGAQSFSIDINIVGENKGVRLLRYESSMDGFDGVCCNYVPSLQACFRFHAFQEGETDKE